MHFWQVCRVQLRLHPRHDGVYSAKARRGKGFLDEDCNYETLPDRFGALRDSEPDRVQEEEDDGCGEPGPECRAVAWLNCSRRL